MGVGWLVINHAGSSSRDLVKGPIFVTFSGVKFVTSIWVISLGHDWKKLVGYSCLKASCIHPD